MTAPVVTHHYPSEVWSRSWGTAIDNTARAWHDHLPRGAAPNDFHVAASLDAEHPFRMRTVTVSPLRPAAHAVELGVAAVLLAEFGLVLEGGYELMGGDPATDVQRMLPRALSVIAALRRAGLEVLPARSTL